MKLIPVIKICPKCRCQVEPKSRVTHHAIFKSASGNALSLATQWQLLRGLMLHQTQVSLHLSTGVSRATIERFACRARGHVQLYVLERQKSIKYGEPGRIVE
eukprot:3759386-Amphidinium_carterae.1